MTKSTITPIAIALFGLTLILLFQISSLLLLIHLNSPLSEQVEEREELTELSERGSGRDELKLISTEDPSDKAPRQGDGRRDA